MDNSAPKVPPPPVENPKGQPAPVVQPTPPVPPAPSKSSKLKLTYLVAALIIFILLVGGSIFAILAMTQSVRNEQIANDQQKPKRVDVCPTDEKACPGGTSAKRLPPKCDFAPCPDINAPTASPSPNLISCPTPPTCTGGTKLIKGEADIANGEFCAIYSCF